LWADDLHVAPAEQRRQGARIVRIAAEVRVEVDALRHAALAILHRGQAPALGSPFR
jgi:hypothetical protein